MMVSNRNPLFQGSIFRFHVCFGGCIPIQYLCWFSKEAFDVWQVNRNWENKIFWKKIRVETYPLKAPISNPEIIFPNNPSKTMAKRTVPTVPTTPKSPRFPLLGCGLGVIEKRIKEVCSHKNVPPTKKYHVYISYLYLNLHIGIL